MRRLVLLMVGPIACGIFAAAEAQEPSVSRETLEIMQAHATGLGVLAISRQGESKALKLKSTPILRYSDPGGITTDASIWAWGDQGRPAVLAGIFFLTQEGSEPKWSCELLSLADGGVSVSSGAGWRWTPESGSLKWFSVKAGRADSARQRLRRMKEIAERYEIIWMQGAVKSQLRLMVQPLHRYADEKQRLVDGGIFSFAAGTNPEALLLVECREKNGVLDWQAAFARFGAARCEARDGATIVWDCQPVERWNPAEPYFSVFGPVEQVFKAGE